MTATFVPSPLVSQEPIPYDLSVTDQESISEAFKLFYAYGLLPSDNQDFLLGDSENNKLFGGAGNDIIDGRGGDDQLYGEAGSDGIFGNAGNDLVDGGTDDDELLGEADNDLLIGGVGNDLIDGGTEVDTVSYDNSPNGVVVNIDEAQNVQEIAYLLRPIFQSQIWNLRKIFLVTSYHHSIYRECN